MVTRLTCSVKSWVYGLKVTMATLLLIFTISFVCCLGVIEIRAFMNTEFNICFSSMSGASTLATVEAPCRHRMTSQDTVATCCVATRIVSSARLAYAMNQTSEKSLKGNLKCKQVNLKILLPRISCIDGL